MAQITTDRAHIIRVWDNEKTRCIALGGPVRSLRNYCVKMKHEDLSKWGVIINETLDTFVFDTKDDCVEKLNELFKEG